MKIPLFDCHCDAAFELYMNRKKLLQNEGHVDLLRAERYEPYAQFFAIWGVPEYAGGIDYSTLFKNIYDYFMIELSENQHRILPCTTGNEAIAAANDGKAAAFFSIEGAELIGCDIGKIEEAYALGIRMINLTWNYQNELAGSCALGCDRGLTDKGKEFVRHAQKLGVIIDVSHLSEPAFWDVMNITQAPVVASHSNSKAVCPNARNLTDDQFRAIAQTGGVAGINLYAPFLAEDRATMDDILRHMDHFLSLCGEGAVAIGGDLDGCDTLPEGMRGIEDMDVVYRAMLNFGFGEKLTQDIFYYNMMRVVK